jgi:very-short-patch-repair endonuclease
MSFDRSQMAKVAASWQSVVVDFTKRNNLLFFKSKTSTLDLSTAPVNALNQLLADSSVSLKALCQNLQYEDAQKVASKLLTKQKHLLEELGVSPIFLALGFCSWTEAEASGTSKEDKTTYAPVFLLQLELENKRSSEDGWKLRPVSELKVNGVIVHAAMAAGIKFDEEAFLGELPSEVKFEDLVSALPRLKNELNKLDSFQTSEEIHLAAFGYQSEAIYRDLSDIEGLMESDIVRALAGDSEAISMMQRDPSIDVTSPDYVDPQMENLILDADASQIEAINIALSGTSVVVEGPPGTGKSQTIANLLAESLASGKKVLFVAQKRAAITAVLTRLESNGLSSLVLDLHEASKGPQVAAQLKSSYENMGTALPVNLENIHEDLKESRSRLVELKVAFESDIRGIGLNLSALQQLHFSTESSNRPEWRLQDSALSAMSAEEFRETEKAVIQAAEAQAFRGDFETRVDSWNVKKLRTSEDVVNASKLANDVTSNLFPALNALPLETQNPSGNVAEFYSKAVSTVAMDWLRLNAPKLLNKPLDAGDLESALDIFSHGSAQIGWATKLKLKLRVALLVSGGDEQKLFALQVLQLLQKDGLEVDSNQASFADSASELLQSVMEFKELLSIVQGVEFSDISVDAFAKHVGKLAKDNSQYRIARYWESEGTLSNFGLAETFTNLRNTSNIAKLTPEEVASVYRSAAAISLMEAAFLSDERLRGLDSETLDGLTRKFQKADRSHLRQNAKKILRLAAENFQSAINANATEHQFLQNEAAKKRAHKPLRELLRRAPNLMVSANPVWAMSPVQVASLLPRGKYFDLVIFDEASQIRPEMAISSIMRGRTVVVAGDSNQLPPTNFFSGAGLSMGDGEDGDDFGIDTSVTENTLKDSESILEAMERVVGTRKKRLLWHYRSRDERLIALSNIEIYGNSLTTFPASDTPDALRHVLVKQKKNKAVATGSQNNEAMEVIELILEHIKHHPNESLGVITFGIQHLQKLEMALSLARREDKKLDDWLENPSREAFFMKNLERVQGDERDAIIISTGYGKDGNGRMNLQWGPLTSEQGRRRLNVAISRAKRRMTLVSNFTLADLSDVKVREGTGVDLYKKFLEYVSNDGEGYSNGSSVVPLNGFELDIKRRLEDEGLRLVPQFGVCNYRIDFAVRHPKDPDKFALAIEADGASYHSGHIARERDRLRQMLLEDRGWTFHRIWSTDWFSNPDREVEKVMEAYRAAINGKSSMSKSQPVEQTDEFESLQVTRKLPHPGYGNGRQITDYSARQLDSIIRYIVSDGLLRTNDEIIDEASKEILGFSKTGPRIKAYLESSIRRVTGK